jgi:tetratricopeptide (TPR) repeat protein
MKVDSVSKALKDGEKCVELAPNWGKGYHRLGAAQHGLKRYHIIDLCSATIKLFRSLPRFDQALQTVQKGLEIEPANQSLWTLLRQVQEAVSSEQKERYAKAAQEREIEEARQKQLEEEYAAAAAKKAEEVGSVNVLPP